MLDRITYEVLRSALYATAREMKVAMMRTAASPIIHAGGDVSAAIFDAEMRLVAQGNDIPTMLGSAVISTRESVLAVGRDNLRPGDVIISNDVYLGGGNHQPDIQLTRPVFLDGEIIAFVMTRGHWTDIGGKSPGSFTPDTWDIFGEGVRIPPVFIYRNDEPVADIMSMIVHNTRNPDACTLDILAQYAGTFCGDRRLQQLARKYGAAALGETMAEALLYSERRMRAQIEAIPDGVYTGSDYIEPVGDAELIPIKVKITVEGDSICFDYTGTAPQVRGGVNCPLSVTCNSTWFAVKAITDLSIPINQGCYEPVKIIAPEGSLVNCVYPASVVSGNTETSPRIIDLLLRTLSSALPDRVIAQSNCAACCGIFSGDDPDLDRRKAMRRTYVSTIDVHAGGMGARPDKDGVSAIRVLVGNAGAQPVELIEHNSPLTIEEWTLVPDTGGAGRWRGGCAARRTYRVGFEQATCTVIAERGRVAPKGLFSGLAGATFNSSIERRNGETKTLRAKSEQEIIARGDRVRIQPAGGGGYGDPLERPAQDVWSDVLDGYVSAESAERDYGVIVSAGRLDPGATEALRHQLRAHRGG
ncbi:hydantoinase B/oxoprolinase family protein [Shinella pollutisoli]|uniref:Hydantoinase B/oxoprolinase family protein n=1 Tax=Shinella pollutisoli TaxID=2250594 RepID=A0ABV7DI61_9HYPH|nr:hydantoinase B/oxoprolinase family protein [Shinella pollutisoli]